MENLFYMATLSVIGGTESFFYYLARKYKTKDITFIIKNGHSKQIERLKQYARVIIWNGRDKFKCKRLFLNYFTDIVDFVEAEEYIQLIHTDYKEQKKNLGMIFVPNPKVTKYIGVSKVVCEHFKEETGLDIELCYNPIQLDKPKRVLRLVSATRLTNEKGKDRMIELAKKLDEENVPYLWTIFTNDTLPIPNPNISYMKPRLDVYDYISGNDYLVQLSDNGEGYGYTIAEALLLGVPVIITPCEAFLEIGVRNGENGFIVPFDMKDINIKDIYEKHLIFEYKAPKDNWNKLLGTKKSNYENERTKQVAVKVREDVGNYFDTWFNRDVYVADGEFVVPQYRADELIGANVCEFVRVIENTNSEKKIKKKK